MHQYWRRPGPENAPTEYILESGYKRSAFLVGLINQITEPSASVLELGCNAGRNLSSLLDSGYADLSAVEISSDALDLLRSTYPAVARTATLHEGALEDVLPTLSTNSYDVVFSMAVLEHVHTESGHVFEHIARVTKNFLITIEDERTVSWRHFARNYAGIFEPLGMRPLSSHVCNLETDGLGAKHVARVFAK